MKIRQALGASVIFLILLVAFYWLHVHHLRVNVVFYTAVFDGLLAVTAAGLLLFLLPAFNALNLFEKTQMVVIWLISAYAIAISVPTVIDRSLSFYILEKLHQRGGGIKQASFEQVFTQEYVREHRLVDVRLTEQLESGTIKLENGCVKLTAKGEQLVRFSSYFRKNWLPKERLLMGHYTDDLTDPFRQSTVSPAYTCQ